MRGRSSQAVITVLVSVCVAVGLGGETNAETASVPPAGDAATAATPAADAAPTSASGGGAGRAGAKGGQTADQNDLFQSLALGSGKGPIRIHSDSLELDYKGSTLVYRGNVEVTQGEVTLNSDTLAITFDRGDKPGGAKPGAAKPGTAKPDAQKAAPSAGAADSSDGAAKPEAVPGRGDADRIKQVIAEGHVKIRQGDRLAEGRRAVFDQVKQTIVLSDGAVLHEGPNQVTGDRIVVYLQEERSVVESGSNSRVQAVFYPGSAGGKEAVKTKGGTGPNAAPSGPVARGDGRSGAAQ